MKRPPTHISIYSIFLLLLSSSVFAQTNYTWNGSSDNDWGNSANWTPSGVPGTGDGAIISHSSRYPILHANDTVRSLTLYSDTIDLNGFQLTVRGWSLEVDSSYIHNGTFRVDSVNQWCDFVNTTVDGILDLRMTAGQLLGNCTLKDTVRCEVAAGFGAGLKGGNLFHRPVFFTATTGIMRTGQTAEPDTFLSDMSMYALGTMTLGFSSTGNYVAGDMSISGSGGSIVIKEFTQAADKDVQVASGSLSNIHLKFEGFHQLSGNGEVDLWNMGTSSTVQFIQTAVAGMLTIADSVDTSINSTCVFNGKASIPYLTHLNNGTRFLGVTDLTTTEFSLAGNHFADTTSITYIGTTFSGGFRMGNGLPDTCMAPITFNMVNHGMSIAYNSQGNYFADDVTINVRSGADGRRFQIASSSLSSVQFDGDIIMNVDTLTSLGDIVFHQGEVTHNGLLKVGNDGFHSGQLKLTSYTQTTAGTIDLTTFNTARLNIGSSTDITADFHYTGTNSSSATLASAALRGNLVLEIGSITCADNDFFGNTTLRKTGTVNNVSRGNRFRGPARIENLSENNYFYWCHNAVDTFFSDLTLKNTSQQLLTVASNRAVVINGDLTIDGDSASVVRIGSQYSGRIARFQGSADQQFNVLNPDVDLQFYQSEVNKPSGRVKLYDDMEISQGLALTKGIIECMETAKVILKDNVIPTASDSSYVEGPVQKIGNDAFEFPVGRNGVYRPISISAPVSASDAFVAEYFESNSDWINSHGDRDLTIQQIAKNEYWTLTRDVGTSTPNVTLSWDTLTSCAFGDTASLRLTGWNGTEWKDLGAANVTGDTLTGSLQNDSTINDYNAFALATTSDFSCLSSNANSPSGVVSDSLDNPLYRETSLIVRFNSDYVLQESVNRRDVRSAELSFFLNQEALDSLESILPSELHRYLLVKVFPELRTTDTLAISLLGDSVRIPHFWSTFILTLAAEDSLEQVCSVLDTARPVVLYAHPNLMVQQTSNPTCYDPNSPPDYPDDAEYQDQLSIDMYADILPLRGINVPPAWCMEVGISEVEVGIVDGGVQADHLDFVHPSSGQSSIVEGFLYNDNPPTSDALSDPGGHGTAVAGIIGATRNNSIGISGIAGGDITAVGVSLKSFKIFNDPGVGFNSQPTADLSQVARAFNSATGVGDSAETAFMKVNILNNSWVFGETATDFAQFNNIISDQVKFLNRNQVSVVASRGNNDGNNGISPNVTEARYPACYNDSWVISVSGTDTTGSYFVDVNGTQSFRGRDVDLAAPSRKIAIRTLDSDGGTTDFSGTSASAPHVTGICALMQSYVRSNQNDLSIPWLAPEDLEFLLQKTATDAISQSGTEDWDIPGYDDYIGWGRANAGAAMSYLEFPEYEVRHYTGSNGITTTLVDEDITIQLVETAEGETQTNGTGVYQADVYKLTTTEWHEADLVGMEVVVDLGHPNFEGIWPRHSSSTLFPELETNPNVLVPHEETEHSPSNDEITGYVYRLKDNLGNTIDWIPFNPFVGQLDNKAIFAYSILVRNRQEATCNYLETPELITEDTTWSQDKWIYNDVIVQDGVTLTVTGRAFFGTDTRLIVEKGGKLVVDGGQLTSACRMWEGVQVYGVNDQNQSTAAGQNHGVVDLENGAIIEHAKIGIDLIDQLTAEDAGGGVVVANNATIQNCAKGVAFGPFRKHNNISYFTNVTFLSNQPLNSSQYNGLGTGQFVSIWDTYGIDFTNCTFEFDHDNPAFTSPLTVNQWPTGINSAFGGYRLLGGDLTNGNKFIDLQNGIVSYSHWGIRDRIHAQYATFDGVYRQAFIAGMAYPKMIFGHHELASAGVPGVNIPSFGYMGNLNWGYRLAENTYTAITTPSLQTGVILDGSGLNDFFAINSGRVEHNNFTGLFAGTQTEQNNLAVQISCNDYDEDNIDWAINPQTAGYLADQGTACPQAQGGTDGTRAGNKFFDNDAPFELYEFNLLGRVRYFSAGGNNSNTVPDSPPSDQILEFDCDMTATDPSCNVGTDGVDYWDGKRFASHQSWLGKQIDLDSLEANIDSSHTQLLLDTITDLNTNDTTLKNVLLNHSPLSDTVLTAYLARDTTVTELNFRDVWLKNLPTSQTVWAELQTEIGKLKTQSIKDTLNGAQVDNPNVQTATSLQRDIRYFGGRTQLYADEVVIHYVENDAIDSAKAYMDTVGIHTMRVALLATELGDGNWDEADSSLVKLPLKTDNDTAMYDLFDILIDLGRDTLTIKDMNSSDSTRVQQIAGDTTLDAAVMAKGILTVLMDSMFCEIPEEIPPLPSGKWAGAEEDEKEQTEVVESPTEARYFKAYPNPFTKSTTIAYNVGKECELGCILRIYDLQGRVIHEEMLLLEDDKGQFQVDMGRYGNGIYYCSLYGNQQLLQTEKLILMK